MQPAPHARHSTSALLACLVLGLAPAGAQGHSELVASSPKDGARLTAAPSVVALLFSAPLRRVTLLRMTDAGGRQWVRDVRFTPRRPRIVRADLRAPGPGSYRVSWAVVAADGFPQGGGFTFRVVGRARR
ncbi:MAG: copper resistance protein CopC [Thermoleophilia bacterium]